MPHESPSPKAMSRLGPPGKTLRLGMLSGLVGLTSMAVGATTSPWLVPPYLVAMAWLLLAPASQRSANEVANTQGNTSDFTSAKSEPTLPGEPADDDLAAKPKTGRGRGRKPKAKAKADAPVEKTAATWVQVSPGKFVRVEVPVEPVVTSTTEPEDDAAPSIDPPEADTEAVEGVSQEPAPAESGTHDEFAPEPIERYDSWRDIPQLVEDEPPDDPGYVAPPEPARLVAVDESSRPGQPRVWPARSARIRPNPRPRLRRGKGRVGAVPRVVLHRS